MEPRHCEEFLQRLDALLGESLTDAERQRLEAHAHQCARCGALLASLRHPNAFDLDTGDDTFVASLMEKTTGSACKRAETLLPAWIDADLAATDAELLRSHLRHCAPCANLARVLRGLHQDLPDLARIDPGPGFTADVMAATRALGQPAASFEHKLAGLWRRLVARPRFAWEFATAASFALMLLCGLPSSPLRPLPQQALAVVQIDPVGLLRSAATEVEPAVEDLAGQTWEHTGKRLQRATAARFQRFAAEHEDAAATWQQLRADLSEVGAGIGQRNFARMSHGLQLLRQDLGRLFRPAPVADGEEKP